MTKEEIIKKARSLYKPTCIFRAAHIRIEREENTCTFEKDEYIDFEQYYNNILVLRKKETNAVCKNENGWIKCIYFDNKFAEIIKKFSINKSE